MKIKRHVEDGFTIEIETLRTSSVLVHVSKQGWFKTWLFKENISKEERQIQIEKMKESLNRFLEGIKNN